jgi:DNA polymerase III delta subunit
MVNYNYKEFIHWLSKGLDIEKEKKYFFYGENIFGINLLTEQLLKKIGKVEKEIVYSFESSVEEIFKKLSTRTLFFEKVVVILKNFELAKKTFCKSLLEFLKNYEYEQYLIIIHEGELSYKELKNEKDGILNFLLKNAVSVNCTNFSKYEVVNNFIPSFVNKKFTESAKELLYDSLGNNLWLLYNELNKLRFYKPGEQEITQTDVEKCCIQYDSSEIKDLFSSIEGQNLSQSLAKLNLLFDSGVDAVYISVSLHRYLRTQFLKKKFSTKKIFEVLKELSNLDYKLKTSTKNKSVLEHTIINLCKILGS